MEQDKQFIATMITAIVALGLITVSTTARADGSQDLEKCFGVVKAGQNDCDTDNGQCAPSMIDASPNEWIYLPKGVCDRLVGGTSAPAKVPGNKTTTTTSTTVVQPGNSAPNTPAGATSTGGFDDGMNAPNTPYVNDY